MNRLLHGVARAACETFDLPGPILEIGSFQVPGQAGLIEMRRYFPDKDYLGLDLRPGPGVDVVASVEDLPFPSGSIGTVLANSTFEHVQRFWRGFDEVHRVLRPEGVFVLSCPFYFHIHHYPSDYWRFTPDALKFLLQPYPVKLIGSHGPRTRPANVWAVAFREQHPRLSAALLAQYRHRLDLYAREPLPWFRRLRYQLGRLFCGSRPFAPWLLREHYRLEVVSQPGDADSRSWQGSPASCEPANSRSSFLPFDRDGRTTSPSRFASSTGTAETSCAAALPH